ncbi:ABC transporter ATP-binding protein [Paenibacillus chitinolyticus]|uniref:ABC transporter ATP-binding protein n=1 Tax=Paenibacillus chitinolyticus TaxID=79263 RepID=UPI0036D85781
MNMEANHLSLSIGAKKILDSVNLNVREGEFIGLIGPNGSGKSTLLKTVYRELKPDAGQVFLDERELLNLPYKKAAELMAVVSQESSVEFDFSVADMVLMGRYPHKKWYESDTEADREICLRALETVGLGHFGERSFATLSGGEKQRVLIARALAQQAKFLILDEPTNHLDIRYQLQIMELVRSLGITTLAALHDLNMAAYYCDRLYIISEGRIAAEGSPAELLVPAVLRDIFGVHAEVNLHALTGKPVITYLPESFYKAGLKQTEESF